MNRGGGGGIEQKEREREVLSDYSWKSEKRTMARDSWFISICDYLRGIVFIWARGL